MYTRRAVARARGQPCVRRLHNPSYYDSMIGKLITTEDRREAMDKMSRALSEYMIYGHQNTIPFEQAILQDPNFRRGSIRRTSSRCSWAVPAGADRGEGLKRVRRSMQQEARTRRPLRARRSLCRAR